MSKKEFVIGNVNNYFKWTIGDKIKRKHNMPERYFPQLPSCMFNTLHDYQSYYFPNIIDQNDLEILHTYCYNFFGINYSKLAIIRISSTGVITEPTIL